jgi:hypothetical protein
MNRNRLFALALLTAGALPVQEASAALTQWTAASGGNGHWYEVVLYDPSMQTELLWANANTLANGGLRGHLATVTSKGEDDFVRALVDAFLTNAGITLAERRMFWLGASQPESAARSTTTTEPGDVAYGPAGGWEWVTGEPWVFTNWYTGGTTAQPANDLNWAHYLHYAGGAAPGTQATAWDDQVQSGQAGTPPRMFGYVREVPVPFTPALLAGGLLALAGFRRGRKVAA